MGICRLRGWRSLSSSYDAPTDAGMRLTKTTTKRGIHSESNWCALRTAFAPTSWKGAIADQIRTRIASSSWRGDRPRRQSTGFADPPGKNECHRILPSRLSMMSAWVFGCLTNLSRTETNDQSTSKSQWSHRMALSMTWKLSTRGTWMPDARRPAPGACL